MFQNNRLTILGLAALLATAMAVLAQRLPRPLANADEAGRYQPFILSSHTFHPDSLNMLDRQMPMQVLEDPSGRLTCQQVAALPDSAFEFRDPCCNFRWRERNTLWLRFALQNHSSYEQFLVEVINPFLDSLTYFQTDVWGRVLRSDTTGTAFAFAHRPDTRHRNFIFPIQLTTNSSGWVYFRVRSEYPVQLRVLVFEQAERKGRQQWTVDVMLTVFYTFCSLYLLFVGILIGVIREHFHWYYFLYVLLTALFIPAHLGLGFMYVWPNAEQTYLQHTVPMALNNLRLIFGIQFFRLYFDLARTAPRFDRFVGISLHIFLFTLLLQIFHHLLGAWFIPLVHLPFFVFLMLFCAAMMGWLVYEMLHQRRNRLSWLLILPALHFVGIATTSLQYLGYGASGLDMGNRVLALFRVANTFFLSPFVMAAFFMEMLLVLYFATRRYLRLLDRNQRVQLLVAKAKEEGLNALLLGVEDERRRIARDLHDSACVNLAAIRMKMNVLSERLPNSQSGLAKQISGIADDLELTYRELREVSHDLMSKALEKTDLHSALEDLALRTRQAQPNLQVELYINYPLDEVSKLAQIHLYRIVQELLGNVLRHAQASLVTVQLLHDETKLLLTMEDDGRGFDPTAPEPPEGIGLGNVRTRVSVLRGHLHLESTVERGTFISIEIADANLTTKE